MDEPHTAGVGIHIIVECLVVLCSNRFPTVENCGIINLNIDNGVACCRVGCVIEVYALASIGYSVLLAKDVCRADKVIRNAVLYNGLCGFRIGFPCIIQDQIRYGKNNITGRHIIPMHFGVSKIGGVVAIFQIEVLFDNGVRALRCKGIHHVSVIQKIAIYVCIPKHLLLADNIQVGEVVALFVSFAANKQIEGVKGIDRRLTAGTGGLEALVEASCQIYRSVIAGKTSRHGSKALGNGASVCRYIKVGGENGRAAIINACRVEACIICSIYMIFVCKTFIGCNNKAFCKRITYAVVEDGLRKNATQRFTALQGGDTVNCTVGVMGGCINQRTLNIVLARGCVENFVAKLLACAFHTAKTVVFLEFYGFFVNERNAAKIFGAACVSCAGEEVEIERLFGCDIRAVIFQIKVDSRATAKEVYGLVTCGCISIVENQKIRTYRATEQADTGGVKCQFSFTCTSACRIGKGAAACGIFRFAVIVCYANIGKRAAGVVARFVAKVGYVI